MRIFFDTEFTGLTWRAKLISIGLVNETGQDPFYAELSNTYEVGDCSEFCIKTVLPVLEHGDAVMTRGQLRKRLTAWLSKQGLDTVLVCDSHRDVMQLKFLIPRGMPPNCTHAVLGREDDLKRQFFNREGRMHKMHGLRAHHALDDAMVNQLALVD